MNFLEALRATTKHIVQYVNNLADERMSETKGLKYLGSGEAFLDRGYFNVLDILDAQPTYPNSILIELTFGGYFKGLFFVSCINSSSPHTVATGSVVSPNDTSLRWYDGDIYITTTATDQGYDLGNNFTYRIYELIGGANNE